MQTLTVTVYLALLAASSLTHRVALRYPDRVAGPPYRWAACAAGPLVVPLEPTLKGRGATGSVALTMSPSPFTISVDGSGRYRYRLDVAVTKIRRRSGRNHVAWVATPDLRQVESLGSLDEEGRTSGSTTFIQFLIFVTEEAGQNKGRWAGPILLTAVSPSGRMHTMAGHGIFEGHTALC